MKPTYLILEFYLDMEPSNYLFIHNDIKLYLLPLQRELLNKMLRFSTRVIQRKEEKNTHKGF